MGQAPGSPPRSDAHSDREVEAWVEASIRRRRERPPGAVRHGRALAIPAPAVPEDAPSTGAVVLGRTKDGWRHVGSVGVRGPVAPSEDAWVRPGLRETDAKAARFVAAWFGGPFDAVGAGRSGGLEWGVWRFDAPGLARVLRAWSSRDREACAAALSTHRFELKAEDGAASVGIDGQFDAVAWRRDPRIIATLATIGRDRGNQLAQIDVVVNRHVRALLEASYDDTKTIDELLDGPRTRDLAGLLALQLRYGLARTLRIVRRAPRAGALLDDVAAHLRGAGRPADANLVLWVKGSPELEVP